MNSFQSEESGGMSVFVGEGGGGVSLFYESIGQGKTNIFYFWPFNP